MEMPHKTHSQFLFIVHLYTDAKYSFTYMACFIRIQRRSDPQTGCKLLGIKEKDLGNTSTLAGDVRGQGAVKSTRQTYACSTAADAEIGIIIQWHGAPLPYLTLNVPSRTNNSIGALRK